MKKLKPIKKIREFAIKCHDDAGCKYDKKSYSVHLDLVAKQVIRFRRIFLDENDYKIVLAAAYCHDLIEDTNISHSKIMVFTSSKTVADTVLNVTDVPTENRLMKHLLTMHKTVGDYNSLLLKMFDILANSDYSVKTDNERKFKMYKREYVYRKPIFKQALSWYEDKLNLGVLEQLWCELDDLLC